MFRNVMVGVDASAGSRDAIALAGRLLAAGGRLTLVHVDDSALVLGSDARFTHDAAGYTRSLARESRAAGPAARSLRVSAGSPGEGLHRVAEEQRADLIVVGSSRRGRLGRALLGDDARAALNGAPCAVAVAPVGFADRPGDLSIIGVAYDGSLESIVALTAARALAAATGATIAACEVVTLPSYAYSSAFVLGWEAHIESVVAVAQERLDALDAVDGRAVYGIAGEELAAFGRDVDVLVVGSRGYGPARRLIQDSTSNYLLGHARCALIVVPRAADATTAPTGADRLAAAGELR